MSRTLTVRHEAEIDLAEAATWYETERLGLGGEFVVESRRTIQLIRQRPESFPIGYRAARRARLDRFPYAVYFVVTDDVISVVAFLHGSRLVSRALRGRI